MRYAIIALVVGGCAGPNLRFDPAPAPPWISGTSAKLGEPRIDAVGRSPATVEVQRDVELATRDAQSQVALMFESQVKATFNDWTLATKTEQGAHEISAVESNVVVKTNVSIEDARVEAGYRDEDSRTQYVRLVVDAEAWATRVGRRVSDQLGRIREGIEAIERDIGSGRMLAGYLELRNTDALLTQTEADAIVFVLLRPESGAQKAWTQEKTRLDALGRRLREGSCFRLKVDAPEKARQDLSRDVESFLSERGFRMNPSGCGAAKTIEMRASLGQRFLREEQVAERLEYVHAAVGSLQVDDADGQPFPTLGLNLPAEAHTGRDIEKNSAADRAISVAASTLGRMFRSAFRRAFHESS